MVFDVDGTLLDTARAKADAFYQAGIPYGEEAAEWLRDFHRQAGSMSREDQVRALFTDHLGMPEVSDTEIANVMEDIAQTLSNVYVGAAKVPGADAYLRSLPHKVCVSGIDSQELHSILEVCGWHFDAVASGRKADVFARLIADGTITLPATYFGDCEDDWRSATENGLDFVLVEYGSGWNAPPEVRRIPDFRVLLGDPMRVRVGRDGYADVNGERRYIGRSLAGGLVTL